MSSRSKGPKIIAALVVLAFALLIVISLKPLPKPSPIERILNAFSRYRPDLKNKVTINKVTYWPNESAPQTATVIGTIPRSVYFTDPNLTGNYSFSAYANFSNRQLPLKVRVRAWVDTTFRGAPNWQYQDSVVLKYPSITDALLTTQKNWNTEEPKNLEAELNQGIGTLEPYQFNRPGMAKARILQTKLKIRMNDYTGAALALSQGRDAVVANREFWSEFRELREQLVNKLGADSFDLPAPLP